MFLHLILQHFSIPCWPREAAWWVQHLSQTLSPLTLPSTGWALSLSLDRVSAFALLENSLLFPILCHLLALSAAWWPSDMSQWTYKGWWQATIIYIFPIAQYNNNIYTMGDPSHISIAWLTLSGKQGFLNRGQNFKFLVPFVMFSRSIRLQLLQSNPFWILFISIIDKWRVIDALKVQWPLEFAK